MHFWEFAWLIPILPLLASLIIAIIGKRVREGGALIAVGGAALACAIALLTAFEILTGSADHELPIVQTTEWLKVGGLTINMGIYLDAVTAVMLIVVSFISTLVVIYSIGYMHEEGERKRRYYSIISLFIGVMLGLVLASNYLEMFVFWELVGLCSYLLIGFWYTKPSAASAAKKAFLVTRIGDIMFMLGLIMLFLSFGNLDFETLFATNSLANAAVSPMNPTTATLATFLIFGGAIGKSAQFPLHDWLPDAMEGPTTVSALIHAATMVKAGVYLVARSYPLIVQTPDTMLFIALIGGFTAFFAATMALNNPNIKRVLAYSTISQLGYMFLALGAGGYLFAITAEGNAGFSAGMSHLMNHAFFKALLFLAAGAVIHAVHTEDMREMGGLRSKLKITSLVMLIGCLSISGIPPLSGFWSKDEVLAVAFETGAQNPLFYGLYILGLVTAFMTAFYMFRLWFMTFTGEPKGHAVEHAHEAPRVMTGPLVILAVLAAVSGLSILFGFAEIVIPETIAGFQIVAETPVEVLAAYFGDVLTYASIIAAILGIGLAYLVYYRKSISSDVFVAGPFRAGVYDVLLSRYGIPAAYDLFGEKVVYGFSKVVDFFDQHIIDGIVNGISAAAVRGGSGLRRVQTGLVQSYATIVIIGVAVLLVLLFYFGGLL